MSASRVWFISAGLTQPKKPFGQIARRQLYLNYGLLGLATILFRKGFETTLRHGNYSNPSEFLKGLLNDGLDKTTFPIFLSLPSCFAIPWAAEFCAQLKMIAPQRKIIVGGRWVVGRDGAWIRSMLPGVDLVVYGTAESRIEKLLKFDVWSHVHDTDISSLLIKTEPDTGNPTAGYELQVMPDYLQYHPSIEVSRGCGMGCSFCAEASEALSGIKNPTHIIEEIAECKFRYNESEFHPYFEASFFRPNSSWVQAFSKNYHQMQLDTKWRCETRVDSISINVIRDLAQAGLKVIDLGLESASEIQLMRMQKTKNPKAYLRRASNFITRCYEEGIWVKVNILLYAGESCDTIRDTQEWLFQHKKFIKGVSAWPLLVYRSAGHSGYISELNSYGARPVNGDDIDRLGYCNMHLSSEISQDIALSKARELSRSIMTAKDYYDLKSFSYFPRQLTYEEFCLASQSVPTDSLPFTV